MPENNAILIQHGSEGHEQLLDITRARHKDYCAGHKIDYYASTDRGVPQRAPAWEKVRLILDALRYGYEKVFWLDADCLIANLDVDLRTACDDAPIGLVFFGPEYANPPHHNTGAMYLRNDPGLGAFFVDVWNDWPVNHPWEDQVAINRQLERGDMKVSSLDYKWNCTPNLPCREPVVMAWHGHTLDTRISAMPKALAALEGRTNEAASPPPGGVPDNAVGFGAPFNP